MKNSYLDTLSDDLCVLRDKLPERFHPRYNKALLNAIIGFSLLQSLTTIPTYITYAENNSLNNTTNVREITGYDDQTNLEELRDKPIEIKTYKSIKIKIGKIEKLKFQSIEDENGFI
jgi:hypothetical protein